MFGVTRILIVSDVHSNLPALDAVLADAERRGGFDRVWCLGDTVGYGAQPNECLDRLRAFDLVSLAGNHDLGAIGAISLDEFNVYAAEANRWTGDVLTPENRQYLAGLPAQQVVGPWTLAHGTPRDPVWEYLFSEHVAAAALAAQTTDWGLVGHTHVPTLAERVNGGIKLDYLKPDAPLALAGRTVICNPGSVGQPRDHDPRAAYALLDKEAAMLTHYRVRYDVELAQELIIDAGLPRMLADRLEEGR